MEPSIFSFIWKYSRRDQIYLLAFTIFTFPFLYATLELPKRIINDAIGADTDVIPIFGYEISQVQFLMALCFAYLAAVIAHGLLKMRLNTLKGILSERLLRRFRYQLIGRMMRFPRSYYQNTSQGELVSMVTSEAEPMGGLMGDFLAQPVFQAGQMLIIVVFLFLQSVWFGLAGVALIPLQAWVIPILQRQINQLNKERIVEVRHFAAEIGETAAGITDLRTNGGWRYRLAQFTDRLGRLFEVRFLIYQKKFFMKFLNNFITQLTPFFFYAVGGYLAIRGQITVGALVAALAAYKDLSDPWKELLTFYNQTQDMAVRWDVVVERFAPRGMLDEALFEGSPEDLPHLRGDISLRDVHVRGMDGTMVLEGITLTIPKGSRVALQVASQSERTALAEVLTREMLPARGQISIAGHDLSTLHQAVVAARIGYAQSQPYLFQGSVGDNLLMALRPRPAQDPGARQIIDRAAIEARRAGNSADSTRAEWLDPALAELTSHEDIHGYWFDIASAMGTSEEIFQQMLGARMDPARHPELAGRIVALRAEVARRLKAEGLDKAIHRFDPEQFNPAVPLGGNLMFAAPRREITQQELVDDAGFLAMIGEQGLAEQAIAISQTLVETLHQTFGRDGTDHPLFTALGIEDHLYEQLVDIAARRRDQGDAVLTADEFALLLTVPFAFTAEQIGPAFPESFKREILQIRKSGGTQLRERADALFVAISPDNYLPRLTVLENLIYGRFSAFAGLQADLVRDLVSEVVAAHDLKQLIAVTLFDVPTAIGGTNLPAAFQERASFSRAVIKRPDVLIFNQMLTGPDAASQARVRDRLSDLLPETTQIYINGSFAQPQDFDMHVEIRNGHIDGVAQAEEPAGEPGGSGDLRRKLRIIARNDLFASLEPRYQRLLAFAAQWYTAAPDQVIFSQGARADAAYLCLSGRAELVWIDPEGERHHVTDVEPGRLIGDLAVILDEPRQLHMIAAEETRFLRLGAEQFRSVVESDKTILLTLLRTVAGHLTGVAEVMKSRGIELPREIGPPPPPVAAAEEAGT